ncbi:MAG: hypothetical protein ACJAVK_000832 [Akkermansiaceae bacterium]
MIVTVSLTAGSEEKPSGHKEVAEKVTANTEISPLIAKVKEIIIPTATRLESSVEGRKVTISTLDKK